MLVGDIQRRHITHTLTQTQKHIQTAPSVFEVDFAVSFYVYVSALIWWFFVCVYTPKSIFCSEWHFRTTYFEARSLSSMGTQTDRPTDRPCAKSHATQHIHFSDSIDGQTEIDKYSFRGGWEWKKMRSINDSNETTIDETWQIFVCFWLFEWC